MALDRQGQLQIGQIPDRLVITGGGRCIRNYTMASGILRQLVYYKQTGIILGLFSIYSIPHVASIPVTLVTTGIL